MTAESAVLTPALPSEVAVAPLELPLGVITGRVETQSGSVRHPAVVARDAFNRSILAESSDEFGNFRIVGPVGGLVTVTVVDPETGERASETLTLDPAVPQDLNFFLGPVGE